MNYLFVDTNILLHFKAFDEIKWKDFIESEFQIVIAPVILYELDKHKYNNNPKISKRSKGIVSKILLHIDNRSYPISILQQRPPLEILKNYQLNADHQDDLLMASIIHFSQSISDDDKCFLVTDDTFASIRSVSLGIISIALDESLRLAEGLDEQAKLIESLKKENQQLKERIPKIDLYGPDRTKLLEYEVQTQIKTLKELKEDKLNEIRITYPFMDLIEMDAYKNPSILMKFQQLTVIGNETRKRYNKELDEFYTEYEEYVEEKYKQAVKFYQSLTLNLILYNEGTSPGENIDVWMHLPDGFTVVDKLASSPVEPKPPYKPKHDFDFGGHPISLPMGIDRDIFFPKIDAVDPNRLTIRKTNSYEVQCNCKLLKHNMQYKINPIFIQYDSFVDMKSFSIDYILNISNVPHQISGKINVKITPK